MSIKRPRDTDGAPPLDKESGGLAANHDGLPADGDKAEFPREVLEKEEQRGSNEAADLDIRPDGPPGNEGRGLFSALVGNGEDV